MSRSILLSYMAARGSAIPAVSTMGVREIKDELYSSIRDDLLSGEHQEACFKALDSVIQDNIFLEEQFKTLLGIERPDKWTYLGVKISGGRIVADELKTFLGQVLSAYREALYFTDGDGWSGFHHLAECHPSLFLDYLPTHSESELSLLKLQTAKGTTLLELFLINADAAAIEALFERLNVRFDASAINELFTSVERHSKYAPIHWVAQKHPQMLPLLLRLLGRFAEEALALENLRGNIPLNIAACFSPAELVDAAPEIVGVVPGAFSGARDSRGCTLNYIARKPVCHQYFFPLLRSLGADHRGLLMVRDAEGFTALSRLATFAPPCLIAELKAGNITPDELLIQDADGMTPVHRLVFSDAEILFSVFSQLGNRLDGLFRMEVPLYYVPLLYLYDRRPPYDMAAACLRAYSDHRIKERPGDGDKIALRRYRKNSDEYVLVQNFVEAMLTEDIGKFRKLIRLIRPEVLTPELKLRLMEKYIKFASDAVESKEDIKGAGRIMLASAAMTAIYTQQKARFDPALAHHNTGLLAVIFKKFGMSVEAAPAARAVIFHDAACGGDGIEMTSVVPGSAPGQESPS